MYKNITNIHWQVESDEEMLKLREQDELCYQNRVNNSNLPEIARMQAREQLERVQEEVKYYSNLILNK